MPPWGEKEVVAGLAVQTTDPASRRGTSYTKLRSHWNRRPWWLDLVGASASGVAFGPWAEVIIHHPLALFHMEHCVIAALLSEGRVHRTCGRPCDRHQVSLRDRAGVDHPVEADVGCRNTVFHARPQSAVQLLPQLAAAGVAQFRIELVREKASAFVTRPSPSVSDGPVKLPPGARNSQPPCTNLHVCGSAGPLLASVQPQLVTLQVYESPGVAGTLCGRFAHSFACGL